MDKIFSNQDKSGHLYFLLAAFLFTFTGLINLSNKLTICAFVYVMIALSINIMSELYGKKKTAKTALACVLASAILLWDTQYYVYGAKIDIILFGSFLSILVSTYCGMELLLRLKPTYNFYARNLISLLACSTIDCSIMASVLSTKLTLERVMSIFVMDIIYKFSISLTVCFCLFAGLYLAVQVRKLKI